MAVSQLKVSTLAGILIFILAFSSCTIQQRRYAQGFHVESNFHKAGSQAHSRFYSSPSSGLTAEKAENHSPRADFDENEFTASVGYDPLLFAGTIQEIKLTASAKQASGLPDSLRPCEKLIMNNGNEFSAIVLEIGVTNIRYKRCENRTGPEYVLPKSLIFSIQHPDGRNEIMNPKPVAKVYNTKRRVQPLGVIGSIFGAAGIIAFGIPLGLLALIMGSLSLSKIKSNPEKLKGRGWAIASMILGGLSILGVFLVLNFIIVM